VNKRGYGSMTIAVVVALAMGVPATASEPVPEANAGGSFFGGIYSAEFWAHDDLDDLNAAAGAKVTFGGTFHSVGENSGPHVAGQWSNTRVLLNEQWEAQATPFANLTIPATASSIAAGNWDAKITEWAGHVKGYLDLGGGRSLIIAPLQEMNGSWTSYGCSPSSFRTAYKRIVDIFRGMGLGETKVRWAFAPNGWTSPGCGSIADYYPGHDYVDITAFSAYNFGAETASYCVDGAFGWETPYQVLHNPTETLRGIAPTKPMIVAQTGAPRTGCGATAQNGGQDEWVRDLFDFVQNDANIVGLVWFNLDKTSSGETDWRVWTGSSVTQGWRDAIRGTDHEWPLSWFQPGQLVVDAPPGPCPGNKTCDTVVFVSQYGEWFRHSTLEAGDPVSSFVYGNPGDIPFMGDWDCDGDKTPGLYRQSDGFVYLRNSNTQGNADITFFFGNPGDVPIVGDFNKNDCDTVSIYRPSQGRFFIVNELGQNGGGLGAADFDFYFGNPYDQPFVGDFDGDGRDTIGLYRVSTGFAYFRNSLSTGNADFAFYYGNPGDIILAADWDGDGDDTVAVYRPSSGRLYVNLNNGPGAADYTLFVGYYTAASRA